MPDATNALHTLAVSGICLDTFEHITARWMGKDLKLAQGESPGDDQGLAQCCFPPFPQLQAA